MGRAKILEITFSIIGTLLLALAASVSQDLSRIARSVEDLNVKMAVVVEQTSNLDKRVMKLERERMEKDIAEGSIGSMASYDVEFKGGKLCAKIDLSKEAAPGLQVHGAVSVELSARVVLDALKKVIPGVLDDAAIEMAEQALGV